MKTVYLAAAVIGAVLPWLFFGSYFAANGPNPVAFVRSLYVNGAAGGFATDIMLSIAVFWVWSFLDARALGVKRWWIVIPCGCCVGLSLALPAYLYLREGAKGSGS